MGDASELAYARNQARKVVSFDEFVKHIADHNGVFSRGTVKGVVSDTCTCLVELLLNGDKIQFGELGDFGVSLKSEGAESLEKFSAANIKEVNIVFTPGADFENLIDRAEFNLVASRAIQAATIRAVKNGNDTLDLASVKKKGDTATDAGNSGGTVDSGTSGNSDSSVTPSGSDTSASGSQGGSDGDSGNSDSDVSYD